MRCNKIRLIAGTAVLSVGLTFSSFQASATDLSSLKEQYASLQQQQQQLQSQLQDQNSQVQTEQSKQQTISAQVSLTKKQISILQTQVDSTSTLIDKKEQEIAATQKQINQNYTLLKERLRAMYMSGDDSFVVVLLNSDGVSDFLNRMEMVKAISIHDNRIIQDFRDEQSKLLKDKKELDAACKDLLQKQGTMAAKQDILNAQLAQQAQVVAQAKANAQSTKQQASAVSQQAAKTDAQINAEIAREAAAAKAAAEKAARERAASEAAAKAKASSSQSGGSSSSGGGSSSDGGGSSSDGGGSSTPDGFGTPSYVVSYAENFIGYPYVFGTAGPDTFDCSGLVQYVFANAAGKYLPHSAAQQFSGGYGKSVSKSSLQSGDLVFFDVEGTGIDHVGIYVGGGEMINAENPSVGVKYDSINSSYWASRYAGAIRVLD